MALAARHAFRDAVVQADIQFSRGVMHVIDAVLLPVPDKDAS